VTDEPVAAEKRSREEPPEGPVSTEEDRAEGQREESLLTSFNRADANLFLITFAGDGGRQHCDRHGGGSRIYHGLSYVFYMKSAAWTISVPEIRTRASRAVIS